MPPPSETASAIREAVAAGSRSAREVCQGVLDRIRDGDRQLNAFRYVDGEGAMARGQFSPASFELTMARKDVRLMLESAGALPLATLPGIAARIDALIAAGHGREDLSALAADAVANSRPGT
jgi:3-hydroxyisobutyrate dehydrogenase-like beta-hydroxyacid dehydrogenase